MEAAEEPTLGERLSLFVRWFVTASPDAVIERRPPVAPRIPALARRGAPQVRPRHAGPVRVVVRAKP